MSAEAQEAVDYGKITEGIKTKIGELNKKIKEDSDDFGKLNDIFDKLKEIYSINSKIEEDINNIYNKNGNDDQSEYYDSFLTNNDKLLEIIQKCIEDLNIKINKISREIIKKKLIIIGEKLLKSLENIKKKCEKIKKFINLLNIVEKNKGTNNNITIQNKSEPINSKRIIKEYNILINLDINIKFDNDTNFTTINSGEQHGSDIVLYLKDDTETGGSNKKRKTKIKKINKKRTNKNKTIKKRR